MTSGTARPLLRWVQVQRDTVQAAEAEALMAKGDAVGAARLFGCIMTPHPPFEDVALRLVDSGVPSLFMHTAGAELACVSGELACSAALRLDSCWGMVSFDRTTPQQKHVFSC